MKSKKFTPEKFEEAKKNLISKYNELGYRDAELLKDSVWNYDAKHVDVLLKVNEGQKYYIRNITWVGNTVYSTDYLSRLLNMKKGDVYNQSTCTSAFPRMKTLWATLIGTMATCSTGSILRR